MTATQDALTPPTPRDSLGCTLDALERHQEVSGPGYVVYRKTLATTGPRPVETPPSGRGLLVGISLSAGHQRRVMNGGRSTLCHFAPGSCYIRPFSDRYRADIETGFDFCLLELTPEALQGTLAELELPSTEALYCAPGQNDEVLGSLAQALLPSLATPGQATPLFVDQVVSAMRTHLAQRYHGATARAPRSRGLAREDLARAKEMLAASLDGQILIGDIASACGVSRSHFIRGFRAATGVTPYHWLLRQRVARARDLLVQTDLSLADVAVSCGFSDQSHMTRLFTKITGATPGAWRRRA
ncbi:AraC family transcriptional regulator [Xanthobacter sp. V4C-4]|uniref:helix-turn-helix domain-containing protein n=1 Tax=Xanthobacter cornucopiae TaxID=3119924 RepID=UPI003727BD04